MRDDRFRVPRLGGVWALALCLAAAAAAPATATDGTEPAAGRLGLLIGGVQTGATVREPRLVLTVDPVGFELTGQAHPGSGADHIHVRVDGMLEGTYAESEIALDLAFLEPGWHTLTFLPAGPDHVEVVAGAAALEIDYEPGLATGVSEPGATAAAEVTVALREWSLEPSDLELPAGTYTFVVPNQGTIEHSLVITGDGFRASTPDATYAAGLSESFTVELTPGTYQLFCPLPWHKTTGMVGTIVVTG